MSEPAAQRNRLKQENQDLVRELGGLQRFLACMEGLVEALESPRPEEEVHALLAHVLENVLDAIGAEDGSLLIPDEATKELVFVLVRGKSPQEDLIGKRIPPGRGIAAWVVENRRATIVNNPSVDDRFYRDVDADLQHRTNAMLAAPLIGGGRVLGVIEVLNRRGGKLFSTANQTLLTLMCRFAGELLFAMVKDIDLTQGAGRAGKVSAVANPN